MPESSQPPSLTSSLPPSHWLSIVLQNFILHSLQLVRICRATWLDKRFFAIQLVLFHSTLAIATNFGATLIRL